MTKPDDGGPVHHQVTDIVVSLRNMDGFSDWPLLKQAADEIERLRDEAERLRTRIANDEIRMKAMADSASGEVT
jgi:hypothetical protein